MYQYSSDCDDNRHALRPRRRRALARLAPCGVRPWPCSRTRALPRVPGVRRRAACAPACILNRRGSARQPVCVSVAPGAAHSRLRALTGSGRGVRSAGALRRTDIESHCSRVLVHRCALWAARWGLVRPASGGRVFSHLNGQRGTAPSGHWPADWAVHELWASASGDDVL